MSGSRSFINSFSLWQNSHEWFRTRLRSPQQQPSKHYSLIPSSQYNLPKPIEGQKRLTKGLIIGNCIRFQVILFQRTEYIPSFVAYLVVFINHKSRCVALFINSYNRFCFYCCLRTSTTKKDCSTLWSSLMFPLGNNLHDLQLRITIYLLFIPNYLCRWGIICSTNFN